MTNQVPTDPLNDDLTTEELEADIARAQVRPANPPPTPDGRRPEGRPADARPADPRPAETDLLLPPQRRDELRASWLEIQSSFIDEPRESVRRADGLVQDLLSSVSERFESARRDLEGEWQRGEGVNTESLRLALRRYRALFDRLLAF
jgi:hypothetical protein